MNKNNYVIKTENKIVSTTYTFSCYILFIYGYKVTVNCKFIKRDARRDSDSYGKWYENYINRTRSGDLVLLLLLLRQSIQVDSSVVDCCPVFYNAIAWLVLIVAG